MHNETILIIDDDSSIGDLEQELLEREGFRTLRAYSGAEALLLLEKERSDLVLLDLMLPEELKADITVHTTSGDEEIERESEPGAPTKVWLKTVSGDIEVE